MKKLLLFFVLAATISSKLFGQSPEQLNNEFMINAIRYNIPVDILKSVAYVESRFQHTIPHEDHTACTGMPHSFGIMGLRNDNWFGRSLIEAASLINASPEMLAQDYELNIQGAAALLSKYAEEIYIDRNDLNSWELVFEKYSGIPQEGVREFYSFDVLKVLSEGTITA